MRSSGGVEKLQYESKKSGMSDFDHVFTKKVSVICSLVLYALFLHRCNFYHYVDTLF